MTLDISNRVQINDKIDDIDGPLEEAQSHSLLKMEASSKIETPSSPRTPMNRLLISALVELEQCQAGSDQNKTGQAWNSLGLVYLHTENNVHEAIRCQGESLKCFSEDDHEEVATSMCDLGFCFERLEDRTQAIELYQRAMEISKNRMSGDHPCQQALNRAIARVMRT